MNCYKKSAALVVIAMTIVALGAIVVAQRQAAAPAQTAKYPAPRFPSYFKRATTVEAFMPGARKLVRNTSGFQGVGLGKVQSGETIAIVVSPEAEDNVVEAIRRALVERKIKVHLLKDYELAGVTRQQADALQKVRQTYTSEQGYMEASKWIEAQFADPEKPKQWLKQRRPDVYDKLFPQNRVLSPELQQVALKYETMTIGAALREWLRKNPGVRGVFWGKGGVPGLRRAMHPSEDKLLGLFTADSRYQIMSEIANFPGDVWSLTEEHSMEPLAYVDQIHITDPEGTDASSTITQVQADRWARGVYERGHLYMFPNQATGRFGASVVNYPALTDEWVPREPLATLDGVLAGSTNHTGFFPRWEVRFKGGYIVDVKGGGVIGYTLREMLQYPKVNELAFPFHENHKGFWWLYEIAIATHPKAFRDPSGLAIGSVGPERLRSGVVHWGLGLRLWHEPSAPVLSKKWMDFTAEHDMPRDHGFHTHQYFQTYKIHLRGTDRWVTVVDRGRLASLDDPEVRALASRYGTPDELLAEDWIPEVPGINAPGRYQDYAANPWATVKSVIDRVEADKYPFFYPPRTAGKAKTSSQ